MKCTDAVHATAQNSSDNLSLSSFRQSSLLTDDSALSGSCICDKIKQNKITGFYKSCTRTVQEFWQSLYDKTKYNKIKGMRLGIVRCDWLQLRLMCCIMLIRLQDLCKSCRFLLFYSIANGQTVLDRKNMHKDTKTKREPKSTGPSWPTRTAPMSVLTYLLTNGANCFKQGHQSMWTPGPRSRQ